MSLLRTIRALAVAAVTVAVALPAVAHGQGIPPSLTIDTNFAPPSGIARDDFGGPGTVAPDNPRAVAVDRARGRVYTVGETGSSSSANVAVVARRADGTLDHTFDDDGLRTISTSSGRDIGTDIVVLPDGRLRLLVTSNATSPDVMIVGLTAAGGDDTSVDTDGRVTVAVGNGTDVSTRMVADSSGRLAITGCANSAVGTTPCSGSDANDNAFVALRNADGTPVAGFGTNGARLLTVSGHDRGVDVGFRPGGGVVVLTHQGPSGAVRPVLRSFDGEGDAIATSSGGVIVPAVPGTSSTVPGGLLVHGGMYWVTGQTVVGQDIDAFLARVRPDGTGFESRRFDMRGRLISPTQAVTSRGFDLTVVGGLEPTLVVAGSLEYTVESGSGVDWAAAAFQGLDGPLAAAPVGDFAISASGGHGLVGVAAGDGWVAISGALQETSGTSDRSFGTARLLIDADKACDLTLQVVEPLELAFAGTEPAPVTLRVANAGTRSCSGTIAATAPFAVAGAQTIPTGLLAPGGSFTTTGARVAYGGPRRHEDVAIFGVSTASDANPDNNRAAVRAVFSFCDVSLATAGRVSLIPNEGSWPFEFTLRNLGSTPCAVGLGVESGGRGRGETFTVDPGRSVTEEIRISAQRSRARASRVNQLVVRATAGGDVDAGNDAVTFAPTVVGVGDSNARKPSGRVRSFSGTARRGSGRVSKRNRRVRRVQIAVRRVGGKRCRWLASSRGRFRTVRARRGRCDRPVWLRARGTSRWRYRLRRSLPAGRYVLMSRATIGAGFPEARFSSRDKNRITFRAR